MAGIQLLLIMTDTVDPLSRVQMIKCCSEVRFGKILELSYFNHHLLQ